MTKVITVPVEQYNRLVQENEIMRKNLTANGKLLLAEFKEEYGYKQFKKAERQDYITRRKNGNTFWQELKQTWRESK